VTGRALLAVTSVDVIPGTGRHTGAYASELAETWKVLTAYHFEVDVVAMAGGRVPLEAVREGDATQQEMLADPRMSAQLADARQPGAVRGWDYRIIALIGGHGAVWDMPGHADLAALVGTVHASGGVVASVCHGAAGLLDAPDRYGRTLIAGRRVAAFTNEEERVVGMRSVVPFLLGDELVRRGASHDTGPSFMPHVVVDERLVTGQNPASATRVADLAVTVALHAVGSRS
jgi:putative intracellular protease/amidase